MSSLKVYNSDSESRPMKMLVPADTRSLAVAARLDWSVPSQIQVALELLASVLGSAERSDVPTEELIATLARLHHVFVFNRLQRSAAAAAEAEAEAAARSAAPLLDN